MLTQHLGTMYGQQGINRLQRQELGAAKKSFLLALEFAPSSAEAHMNLGRYYLDLNDTESALSSFERAIELDASQEEKVEKILGTSWSDPK